MVKFILTVCSLVFVTISIPTDSQAQDESQARRDRHVGYYYPPPQTSEKYKARPNTLPGSDRKRRVAFVTQFMVQVMAGSFAPGFALFPKGERAEKLIIVSTQEDRFDTLYRMRALLAILTVQARRSELFQSAGVADIFTFLDLLKLIGFEQVTVTDGDDFAHQIFIE